MCGITGVYFSERARVVDTEQLRAMANALAHRGPDGDGVVVGPGWGFAHRRLAIVDLASGQQPMTTADGTLTVTFNGEIYNYLEVRAVLEQEGAVFCTNSDTEVLLHGYRAWGTGLARHLDEKKIGNRMFFGGNLLRQPVFVQLRKDRPEAFRVVGEMKGADAIMNQAIFLGTYPGLTNEMMDYEIQIIRSFVLDR